MLYVSTKKRDSQPVLYAWGELEDSTLHVAYGAINTHVADSVLELKDEQGKRVRVTLPVERHTKGLPKSFSDVELEVHNGNQEE